MKEHDQGRYVFDLPENLQSKMMSQLAIKRGVKQPHKFYGYKIGHLPDPTKLSKWSIQDPESEKLLAEAVFQEKDSSVCFREKSIQVFFQRQYSIKDLQHAVHNFTVDSKNHASLYIQRAKSITNIFAEKFSKSKEYAYGCCLAIALYTGIKSKEVYESERVSRVGNQAIKLHAADQISKIEDSQIFRHYMCIGQWLINALNSIGLHWGKVTRCVDLREDEYQMYNPGNIITWLQFSSSSVGKPSEYFADRNTRFIIYSISGRCIKDFSEYKEEETEVLFKPFSHFMVYKKQTIVEGGYQKTIFYMRQVFLGQSHRNLLWVDDFIFDPTWQNKQLMQTALYRQPFLNIIPKVNTQCAMAFLKSELGKNRSKADFRIITDMNRYNQQPYHNAGARFVKETKALKIPNDIMIFTSSIGTAVNNLKALGIDPSNVKITVSASEAVKFLTFK